MRLEELLQAKRTEIVKKWLDQVVDSYAADTSKFLKAKKDPFDNPVGNTFGRNLEVLFDALLAGPIGDDQAAPIDAMVRIRAVQAFSPSKAVAFVFSLKYVLRKTLARELRDPQLLRQLLAFEPRIDELGFMAFDIYVRCREKIFAIKANEQRNRTLRAFQRAGLICEIPEEDADLR